MNFLYNYYISLKNEIILGKIVSSHDDDVIRILYQNGNIGKLTKNNWINLAKNPNMVAVAVMINNRSKLDELNCWKEFATNVNSHAVFFIINEINQQRVDEDVINTLAENPSIDAVEFVIKNSYKLNKQGWRNLKKNPNKRAVDFIENKHQMNDYILTNFFGCN